MGVRGRLLVVAAASLLAGCSGGSDTRDEAAAERRGAAATTEAEQSTTATRPAPDPDAPPSRKEVRWAGRLVAWVLRLEDGVESVAAALPRLDAGGSEAAAAQRAILSATRRLERCPESYEKIGASPSLRLGKVGERMLDACSHLADGAMSFLASLSPDATTAERRDYAKTWRQEWKQARVLVRRTAPKLIAFSPANRPRLPERAAPEPATRVDPRYGEAAGKLVGKPVEVRCWSSGDWSTLLKRMRSFTEGRIPGDAVGFAGFGDDTIHLAEEVCDGLARLVYRKERPTSGPAALEIAFGVGALAHETRHVAGTLNEATATCLGMQLIRRTARVLGAQAAYGDRLAELFWTDAYPALPPGYRSDECRDGGAMDTASGRSRWP